jgi:hypothetical protein
MSEVRERLFEMLESVRKDLERCRPEKYIDDVLEVRRVQSLIKGSWTTLKYVLVVVTGGPHIEIDSKGIHGYWGVEEAHLGHTDWSKSKYNEIGDLLDELE